MVHYYHFKNFLSFKDEVHISFELPKIAPKNDFSFKSEANPKKYYSKVLAVFGPNASGKTNLLKPLSFLAWFINNSFFNPINNLLPFTGHFVGTPDIPTEFLIEFEIDKKIFQYELIASARKVLKETLRTKTSTKFSYIFERTIDYKKNAYQIKQDGFNFNQQEAEKVRPNASLISTAAQYQTPIALELKNYFANFGSNVGVLGRGNQNSEQIQLMQASNLYESTPQIKEKMLQIMKKIDLGLHDIEFTEEFHTINQNNGQPITQRILTPTGIHLVNNMRYKVPFLLESNGTRSAFILLYQILYTLEKGGILIMDELEHDFHPDLLDYLLNFFINPSINPKNAQIIFTTHRDEVMNLLDKTQIILVEKDIDCISHSWCLNDMKGIRRDENWLAKYRTGAYRAIPNLN